MRRVRKASTAHQPASAVAPPVTIPFDEGALTLAMIQALIPLGLRAVEEALQQERSASSHSEHLGNTCTQQRQHLALEPRILPHPDVVARARMW